MRKALTKQTFCSVIEVSANYTTPFSDILMLQIKLGYSHQKELAL